MNPIPIHSGAPRHPGPPAQSSRRQAVRDVRAGPRRPRRVIALAAWILLPPAACVQLERTVTTEVTFDSSQPAAVSQYVEAADGTRLAADVYLPGAEAASAANRQSGAVADDSFPALLTLTRYRRGLEDPVTGEPRPALSVLDGHFLSHGYALVRVDLRGSGASFGTRPVEYGPQEVMDIYEIIEWVVRQPWSDGNVGAFGTSYTGTTAELAAAVNHPALKAVIPGWSDFDTYASPVRPYGLLARSFLKEWSQVVGAMDRNDTELLGAGVRRVHEDADGSLLAAAVAEHAANPDVLEVTLAAEFRDDEIAGGYSWAEASPLHWRDEIQASGVPMLVFASWLDAGTADGALSRLRNFANPQKVVILASTHGGTNHASPYLVGSEPLPPSPSLREQMEMRRLFFDRHLKGEANEVDDWPALRFFNMGTYGMGGGSWHEADRWPPAGTETRTLHMDADGKLAGEGAEIAAGADRYQVDREVTVGPHNRWYAQLGNPVLNLDDRGAMDARMLTYTTPPLETDLQIAGSVVATLRMAADREDGSLFVYLEDVDPTGRSRFVTDGGMRLIHRKVSPNPYFPADTPYHSYARADAQPMPVGEAVRVVVRLWPTAALIRAGHRIRIAIAGADADTFDPLPADGEIAFTIHRGGADGSRVALPVVEGGLGPGNR